MAFFTALNADHRIVNDEGTVFPAWAWAYQTPVFRLTLNAARYEDEDEWFYVVETSGPDIDGGERSAWLGPFIERFCDAAAIQGVVADLLNHGLTHATAEGWNAVADGRS